MSRADARRMALASQGFGVARVALREAIERMGVLQMDSVNVLARAHYLPLWSRGGAYDRGELDALAYGPRRALFEYWGHEASLLPVAMHPLFRWRMERALDGQGMWAMVARFARERRAFCEDVLREVRAHGPLRASEVEARLGSGVKKRGRWWTRSESKAALEWLFWAGRVTTASRRHFERVYDVPERVLPPEILAAKTPAPEDAHRELLRIAARALGVATEDDLRDYFRLSARDAKPRLAELVEEGELEPVSVEGFGRPAFLAKERVRPRGRSRGRASVRCLLAPFDPLVWYRPRVARVFEFRYRIEIYTPAHRREHGYYVLPFLLGDRLVARVDLKSERVRGVLEVRGAHVEPGVDPGDVAPPLAEELRAMATWLALGDVRVVSRRGRLAPLLATSLRA